MALSSFRRKRTRQRSGLFQERLEDRRVLDGTVVFNEIMYNPAGDDAATEWIELHNQMSVDIEMTGWTLDGGVEFAFAEGTILESGGYLVIARDPAAVAADNGLTNVQGPFQGRLSNGGDTLELRNHTNRLMNSIAYDDDGDWPVAADGSGASLAKVDPQQASEIPANWTYSAQVHGTPGRLNFERPSDFNRETLLPLDAEWRFDQSGSDLGTTWRDDPFDDSSWQTGNGLFFAESSPLPGPKSTPLELGAVTYYFRTTFQFDGDADGARLRFRHVIDDGAVFYVNGQEVDRFKLPGGDIDAATTASSVRNATLQQGVAFDASLLRVGTNTVAVEVHQQRASSNDVVFGTELVIDRPTVVADSSPADLQFSEIADGQSDEFWIELANRGSTPFSLDGFSVDSSEGASVQLAGSSIPAGGVIFIGQQQLGFDANTGDRLFLYAPQKQQVVDAIVVRDSVQARADELDRRWQVPSIATPGAANQFEFHDEVVINELLYNDRPTYSEPAEFLTEKFVPYDSVWRFDQSGSDQGAAWRMPTFDDTAWSTGNGLFFNETGALPGPKTTELELGAITYYFRSTFEWNRDAAIGELVMTHIVDDGAVFYLNGVEFSRFGLPDGDVTFQTEAERSVRNGGSVGPIVLPASLLIDGTNTLAVEVHQSSPSSNDVAFGVELNLRAQTSPGTPFVESEDEWIEIYNRSESSVDLSGWSFDSGIQFDFPDATFLDADEYAVIARDVARFAEQYPGVRTLGEYSGTLSNRGERIRLVDDLENVADEVNYFDGGYWPAFADGGGTSLELIDPDADNRFPTAWASSDESERTQWQHVSYTETISPIVQDPPINFNEMVIGLLSAGEILVDNISVIEDPEGDARELIQNGSFENDAVGAAAEKWRAVGTHRDSRVITDPDDPTNQVLRLISEGRSSYLSNHIETTLVDNTQVRNGETYQISFDARWVTGSPQFRTELFYKDAARTSILQQPNVVGTPGARNSIAIDNLGPTISQLSHRPIIPGSSDEVTIRTTLSDPDGVSEVTLHYRVDERQDEFTAITMTANSDGSYVAVIPPQANRDLVQFYVSATDASGVLSVYPPEGPESRALYRVDDAVEIDPVRHDFRILMTDFDTDELHRNVNMMDNNRRGATVIYDGVEVFYDIGTRMRGSMFSRQNRDRTGYNLEFPPDHLFRGVHDSVALDQNGEDEIFVKFVSMQSGNLGGTYDDVLNVVTPSGVGGGPTLAYLSRQTETLFREQFENGEDGTLFKFEGIRVLTSTSVRNDPESLKLYQPIGWVGSFDIQDLGDNKELYRWPFLINRNRAKDDYQPIIDMAKAFSLTGQELEDRVGEVLDMDSWTNTFALMSLLGIGDAYSQGNPHNLNFYVRPDDGKVLAFPWDWDFVYTQSATAPLHGGKNIGRILDIPRYERMLMGHMNDIMRTTLNRDYMARWAAHYGDLIGSNLTRRLASMESRNTVVRSYFPDAVPFQTDFNPPVITRETLVEASSPAQVFIPTAENGGDALGRSWVQPGFVPDDAWRAGQSAVGFESSPATFDPFISFPIPEMKDTSTSVYTRIPFNLSEEQIDMDSLQLSMRYDDGFIAYLNGVEVVSANSPDNADWNSRATASHRNSQAVEFVNFDLSDRRDLLRTGQNVLAIHGMNRSLSGSDALFAPELFGETIELLPPPELSVNESSLSVAGKAWIDIKEIRLRDATQPLDMTWSTNTDWATTIALESGRNELFFDAYDFRGNRVSTQQINVTSSAAQPVVDYLRISEIMYHPAAVDANEAAAGWAADDFEFVELQNISGGPDAVDIDLTGVVLAGGIEFALPPQTLAAGDRLVVGKNPAALSARYGRDIAAVGPYEQPLSNRGDTLRLLDINGLEIVAVKYADRGLWPELADGAGSSLELNESGVPRDEFSKYYHWSASGRIHGTPGSGPETAPDVRINEVLSNSAFPVNETDSIELFNAGADPVDLSGWFLSDSLNDLLKFAIPDETILGAGEYLVFDEDDFNANRGDPGARNFALNGQRGDDVSLVATDENGTIRWLVDEVHFRGAMNGVSFGRVGSRMIPMSQLTLGAENSTPQVGPLVISEVNYHPGPPSDAALAIDASLTADDLEFVEISNRSSEIVNLSQWRLSGDVTFDFPVGETLLAGESIAIVPFDVTAPANRTRLAALRAHYQLPEEVRLLGGLQGQLSNSFGQVRVERLVQVGGGGLSRLLTDEIVYDDRSPWPAAGGTGDSLTRRSEGVDGGDPASWQASEPSLGRYSEKIVDLNGDGVVDVIDVDLLSVAIRLQNEMIDLDGDGETTTSDLDFMITRVLETRIGDANLDGIFNSVDLILLFQVNEYEDDLVGNSTWAEGDWNADGEFDSRDLVGAFGAGGYIAAAKPQRRHFALYAAAAQRSPDGARADFPIRVRAAEQHPDAISPNADRKRMLELGNATDRESELAILDHVLALEYPAPIRDAENDDNETDV